MALIFKTNDPGRLLAELKKAINDRKIVTWSYDQDNDFTHTPDQWKNLAWMRPEVKPGELVFSIVKPQNKNVTSLIYAVYHGRFVESLLNHLDAEFSQVISTALPSEKDRVA